ncbi:MAG: saccharopine dehydrogenase [Chlorobi bacterium]|nr:saccharopine dehydrogenase [Chlorobiota bacterium]
MKVIILGAGLIGAPMAIDLAKENEFDVGVADINRASLDKLQSHNIKLIETDLSIPETVRKVISDYDYVINAVPGSLGFKTLRSIIEAGKNVVDIAFYENDPFELDELAKEKNVTAIVDCGVSPGLHNILIGNAAQRLDSIEDITIYVGGLPQVKEPPFEYKAVFSPSDVIEEYIRPARIKENGKIVTKPPLSDLEIINFPGVGELEAFNSDGLRTLLHTIDVPNMKEKTLRFPGHVEKISLLKDIGLFDKEELAINGNNIKPIDIAITLLKDEWKLKEGDKDFTLLQIIINGKKNDKRFKYTYDLLDHYDDSTQTISMARTTGYTATSTLRMLASGLYKEVGISPLEFIGKNAECTGFILGELRKRNVLIKESIHEKF